MAERAEAYAWLEFEDVLIHFGFPTRECTCCIDAEAAQFKALGRPVVEQYLLDPTEQISRL